MKCIVRGSEIHMLYDVKFNYIGTGFLEDCIEIYNIA